MANSRLVAVVTALLMIAGTNTQAQGSIDQLKVLNRMIDRQDWSALRTYVERHPALTQGSGALAKELRAFMKVARGVGNGIFSYKSRKGLTSGSETAGLY